jgi:serine/threonine protein kinase
MYMDMTQEWTSKAGNQTGFQAQPIWRACPTCNLNLEPTVVKCPRDGTDLTNLGQIESLFDGQYKILSVIASGGMGTVYKAIKRSLLKTVAIKMLKTQDTSNAMFDRFRQEAYTASLLNHPNIIGIEDFGITSDGQPYMVMDFIEGEDLSALIKAEGKLKPAEAVAIFVQIVDAMEHAHSKSILHRDLKPSNVMIANSTTPHCAKIVDFGIAKFVSGAESQHLTQTGELFGSPYYMSPEQTNAKQIDHRSDIYAVGCIMYEALAGEVPLAGNSPFETLMKHTSEKPIPIQERNLRENISEGLQKVVAKALEKDPGKRQQSMKELKTSLESLPEAKGKQASIFSLSSTTYGITPKNKKMILASAGTILLLSGISCLLSQSKSFNGLVTSLHSKDKAGNLAVFEQKTAPNSPSALVNKPIPTEHPQVKWSGLNNADFKSEIGLLPDTNDLWLSGCTIDDDGAKYFSKLNLTHLKLSNCTQIKVDGYKAIINSQPHLTSLNITSSGRGSSDGFDTTADDIIPELKNLRELKILELNNFAGLTGKTMAKLPATIESLSIKKNKRLTTNNIAELAAYINLKKLDLSNTVVSNATLAKLTRISGLQELLLNECPIGNEAMGAVAKFKNLRRLEIQKTAVDIDGLLKLVNLNELSEVNVKDSQVQPSDAMTFEKKLKHTFCAVTPYINSPMSRSREARESGAETNLSKW